MLWDVRDRSCLASSACDSSKVPTLEAEATHLSDQYAPSASSSCNSGGTVRYVGSFSGEAANVSDALPLRVGDSTEIDPADALTAASASMADAGADRVYLLLRAARSGALMCHAFLKVCPAGDGEGSDPEPPIEEQPGQPGPMSERVAQLLKMRCTPDRVGTEPSCDAVFNCGASLAPGWEGSLPCVHRRSTDPAVAIPKATLGSRRHVPSLSPRPPFHRTRLADFSGDALRLRCTS